MSKKIRQYGYNKTDADMFDTIAATIVKILILLFIYMVAMAW